MWQAESFYARIISDVEFATNHATDAQTCAEGIADEVLVLLLSALCSNLGIDLWQHTSECLAISIEITVIVDEDRDTKLFLQERTECHTVAEGGKVGKESSDDAVGIISRAREGETDSKRFFRECFDHTVEPFDHCI